MKEKPEGSARHSQAVSPSHDLGEQFRLLIENVTDYALFLTDTEGTKISWSVGVERVIGYTEQEFLGQPPDLIFTPEDRQRGEHLKELRTAAAEGRAADERWHVKKDGSYFWGSGIMTALYGEAGDLRGFCKIVRDNTARKQEEERLRERLEFTRAITESVAEGIYAVDAEGRVTFINTAGQQMLGWSEEELLGRNSHEAIHYCRADGTPFPLQECPLMEVLRSGVVLREHEDLFIRRDGSQFPALCSSAPLVTDKQVKGAVLAFTDITERKRVERALHTALEREKNIADSLQRPLTLPVPEDIFPGIAIATQYEAALEEAQVGGDWFDAFALPRGRIALAVGDASGKGLAAAARAIAVKEVTRAFAREYPHSLAHTISRLNDYVFDTRRFGDNPDESFVTLALAVIDPVTGEATVVTAGSEPALILRASGEAQIIEAPGLPLGIEREELFTAIPLRLAPGDTLLMVTDGLTEARRGREFLGYEGVVALAKQAVQQTSSVTQATLVILDGARAFADGTLRDDACVLLARRT